MSRYREFLAACPRLMIFFLCCRVLLTAQTPVPPDDAPITDRERALLDRITRLLQYHLSPKLTFAGRFEYLQDHGGLFSGLTQDLKEHTLTATYQFADGFQT